MFITGPNGKQIEVARDGAPFQQGDVLFIPVKVAGKKAVPDALKKEKTKRQGGRLIVAAGEMTGHHHAIADPDVEMFDLDPSLDEFFVKSNKPFDLSHEEHSFKNKVKNAGSVDALTPSDIDYIEIGKWIHRKLKEYDIWIVLMPEQAQRIYPFVKAIESHPDWRLVFLHGWHKIFVDITTSQGKQLFEGILTGETLYPDNFTEYLAKAHALLLFGEKAPSKKQGLDFAIKAFRLNPSEIPMDEIIYTARFSELAQQVHNFCRVYVNDFKDNKSSYARQYGYLGKIQAAIAALSYLRTVAYDQKEPRLEQYYEGKIKEYKQEEVRLLWKEIAWN